MLCLKTLCAEQQTSILLHWRAFTFHHVFFPKYFWYWTLEVWLKIFHLSFPICRATNSLFAALENSSEAIQITSENRTVQYLNPAYERVSGFTNDEVLGQEMEDMPRCDKNKVELIDGIYSQLKKGKVRSEIGKNVWRGKKRGNMRYCGRLRSVNTREKIIIETRESTDEIGGKLEVWKSRLIVFYVKGKVECIKQT